MQKEEKINVLTHKLAQKDKKKSRTYNNEKKEMSDRQKVSQKNEKKEMADKKLLLLNSQIMGFRNANKDSIKGKVPFQGALKLNDFEDDKQRKNHELAEPIE